jgi:hypothetical protein
VVQDRSGVQWLKSAQLGIDDVPFIGVWVWTGMRVGRIPPNVGGGHFALLYI